MKSIHFPKAVVFSVVALVYPLTAAGQVQDSATKFEYDSAGNLKTETMPLNRIVQYEYDLFGRQKRSVDPSGAATAYGHDALSQLTSVTDARSVATVYTVNGFGEQVQTVSPDTGITVNTFDQAGNLTQSRDAKQQLTAYKYDALNRLTLITFHDGTTVAYGYDQGANAVGKLSSIVDASGTTSYSYGAGGKLLAEARGIAGISYVTSYRYDPSGRLSGMTYPSGRSINYERDSVGRISKITGSTDATTFPIVAQVAYRAFGPVASLTFGNGQTQSKGYDLDGRMTSFSLSSHTMAVSYDAASRITGIADAANPAAGHTFGYDAADRLTSVSSDASSQTYVYDAVGNRTQKTNNAAITSYAYANTSNRLVQVGAQPIATDANGSIIDKPGATFNYDARGRMVSANTPIGLVTYTINSLGQRVRKVAPTETTVYHYDLSDKLIAETTTAGNQTTTQEYVYLGDMPVAVLK